MAGEGSWVYTSSSDEGAEVVSESRACEEGPVVELEEGCWRYLCSATTGQVEVWVTPRVTLQVFQNGSVLEAFMRSRAEEGVNERSARQRHVVVLYVLADGVQNSLARRKP